MPCPDPLLVQAYADGELDAAEAIRMEAHLAGCAACEALRRESRASAEAIRTGATYHRLSAERHAQLLHRIGGTSTAPLAVAPMPRRRWQPSYWTGALSGALAAAVGVLAVTSMLDRGGTDPIVNDVVGAHIRSLLSDRLIDVESSDRHTVKPWFAGHADVSPPVVDYAAQNYRLVGGRVDYVDGRRAAVVVYRHGAHVINVFAWPDSGARLPAGRVSRNGYNVVCWKGDSIDYCAASDAVGEELAGLVRLLDPRASGERRE